MPVLSVLERFFSYFSFTQLSGSSASVVLSNKEKAARAGLLRQRSPPLCMMDDFLGKTSLNATLRWFLGGSTQWLSTGSAGEPTFGMASISEEGICALDFRARVW